MECAARVCEETEAACAEAEAECATYKAALARLAAEDARPLPPEVRWACVEPLEPRARRWVRQLVQADA